jgi:hypothetical protein
LLKLWRHTRSGPAPTPLATERSPRPSPPATSTGSHGCPAAPGTPKPHRAAMFAKLGSDQGKTRYAKRKQTVEPVFGQLKERQGARRFTRRGLAACDAEWKLLCGTHNLLKLWRHTRRQPAPIPTAT